MKLIIGKKRKLLLISFVLFLLTVSVHNSGTSTETEEKSSNSNAINISEGKMKHRSKHRKSPTTAVAPSASISSNSKTDSVSQSGGVGKSSNLLDVATKSSNGGSNSSPTPDSLGEGPIFHTSWVKYFKYSDQDKNGELPKHFFKNNFYYDQMKLFPNLNLNQTSTDGASQSSNSFIKSPSHFYAVVFKNNVNLISSRMKQLQKTFDVMNIESIKPVQETPGFGENKNTKNLQNSNGIQEFGNFNEGFCFKVLNTRPRQETWVFCTDTEEEKKKFMMVLKKLKIEMQREAGIILAPGMGQKKEETISDLLGDGGDKGKSKNLQGDKEGNLGVSFDANQKITDGYWIVLQDWTQCSLKCGGGTSTLQRMCVPPKNGGAPCEGEAILTRKCNNQPCPDVNGTSELKAKNNTVILKPMVKVLPFSSRPQRYSKCVVKESDLMMTKDTNEINGNSGTNNPLTSNKNTPPKLQIPVRVVMNNRTISIFSGEDYDSQVHSFTLKETNFKRSLANKNCFILHSTTTSKRVELCPFGFNTNGASMIEEWDYDFNLFKHQCFTPLDKIEINKNMEDELKKKLDEKIKNAKKEILEEREKEIKKKVELEEESQIETVIKKTNQVALQAIQKELNLESMIRQEEAERERKEEIEMIRRIEEEKKKSDCLMKAIKERQLENQYNVKAKEADEEINNIKKTAADQVLIRRSQLKKQIMDMRKKAQRRKAKLAQQLQTVRMTMADTMGKVYKKGNGANCQNAMKDQNSRNIYCQANFPEDYVELMNCKDSDDFCMLCCDHEFGDMYMNERTNCHKTYCPQKGPGAAGGNPNGDLVGRWIWQNELNK